MGDIFVKLKEFFMNNTGEAHESKVINENKSSDEDEVGGKIK